MSSHLRAEHKFEPFNADTFHRRLSSSPAASEKQNTSRIHIRAVAVTARLKLGREVEHADHDLRRLVGHANLLDKLMIRLADAEREHDLQADQRRQETLCAASRHVQRIDVIAEEVEYDDSDSDPGSDAESYDGSVYDEVAEILSTPFRCFRTAPVILESEEIKHIDDEDDTEFDSEWDEEHALTRVASQRSSTHLCDYGARLNDDSVLLSPLSPEKTAMEHNEKEKEQYGTSLCSNKSHVLSMGARFTRQARLLIINFKRIETKTALNWLTRAMAFPSSGKICQEQDCP